MRRLPVAAFGALAVATIAAFFITQHLKSNPPLIGGVTRPPPFSNDGDGCRKRTSVNFYLYRSDRVIVSVMDSAGDYVQTVASGIEMRAPTATHPKVSRRTFSWDGREANGQLAPNGTYYFRVTLTRQFRYIDLTQDPILVDTVPPHLLVTGVSPSQLPAPGGAPATVHFTGTNGRSGLLIVYRTDLGAAPQSVTARKIPFSKRQPHGYTKTWNGLIRGRPAPPGTYVMALKGADRACVTGTFPAYLPPRLGTTPHAGVTVSYLAAEPPLDPIAARSVATVGVQANQQRYRWALRSVDSRRKLIARGSGTSTSLRVRLPGRSAGLYELAIRAAGNRTVVPVVTRADSSRQHILVVLPVLSWQGDNPVDDNGDGFPDTLATGGPIVLHRPLVHGLPGDFAGEAALLTYLDRTGLPYDLTTDVALADGSGPTLAGHSGVVFAGPEQWLPAQLAPQLQHFVEQGGRVLSLGAGSLLRTATVKQTAAGLEALGPSAPAATDVLDARPGALVSHNTQAIVSIRDRLGMFRGTSGAFSGFGSFAPIPALAAPARMLSEAGTTTQTPSIVGYRLGSGVVVDIGLPAFTVSLAHDVDTQELLRRLWTILAQ